MLVWSSLQSLTRISSVSCLVKIPFTEITNIGLSFHSNKIYVSMEDWRNICHRDGKPKSGDSIHHTELESRKIGLEDIDCVFTLDIEHLKIADLMTDGVEILEIIAYVVMDEDHYTIHRLKN